jgi:hypothetical protein
MIACRRSEQLRRPIWLTAAKSGLEGTDSSKVSHSRGLTGSRQRDSLAAYRAELGVMGCEDDIPRVGHLEVRAGGSL